MSPIVPGTSSARDLLDLGHDLRVLLQRDEAQVELGLRPRRHGVVRVAALDDADIGGDAGLVIGQRVQAHDLARERLDGTGAGPRGRRRNARRGR